VLFTDNFVGEAELSLLSETCVTEVRHILALTGASDVTYGSLTVEVHDRRLGYVYTIILASTQKNRRVAGGVNLTEPNGRLMNRRTNK